MKPVVHRGRGHRPEVALTYDDGPGATTRAILDLLAAHGAQATFFMVGTEARASPELACEVAAAGHEIGSHSMHHLDHEQVAPEAAVEDMLAGARAIAAVLGFEPALYRAPYGHFTAATTAEASRRGWKCVHWSALGEDWEEEATAQSVADRVTGHLEPGAIIVLHDSRRAKPMNPDPVLGGTALLLEELRPRGLRAVTVSEMMS